MNTFYIVLIEYFTLNWNMIDIFHELEYSYFSISHTRMIFLHHHTQLATGQFHIIDEAIASGH